MNVSIHHRIRDLLEETNDAFVSFEAGNADFAEFAGQLQLPKFQHVLDNPDLTRDELTSILRSGITKHEGRDPNSWAHWMAQHVAKAANFNSRVPAMTASTRLWQAPVDT